MERKIRAFVMDVDGTLTDGKIYMGIHGEEFKAFHIKDGYGIHNILPKYGIKTAFMTARKSDIVQNRAKELEIDFVLQNVRNKQKAVRDLANKLQCSLSQIAYIGDDIIDIDAMLLCGIKGCPADAALEVRNICDFVSPQNGGHGAVRDFIEWLVKEKMN